MQWFAHILGLDDPAGRWYLFWSGIGADLGEIAIVGSLVGLLRKHQCHVQRCWRLARHRVDDTGHMVCAKHHPVGAPTARDISGM